MQEDFGELDNQHKGYFEFINNSKLYHTLISRCALDLWFSNAQNLQHFIFYNHIWWHDKAIALIHVSLQGLSIRYFLLHEHHDAMYNGHVGVTKTWKRVQVTFIWLEMQGSIMSSIKSCEICQQNKTLTLKANMLVTTIGDFRHKLATCIICHP
jgi:hypothetical protein